MFKDVTSAERRRRITMTAILKKEATIKKFSFLEKHLTSEIHTLTPHAYTESIFLSRTDVLEHVYLYKKSGELWFELKEGDVLEKVLMNSGAFRACELFYLVTVSGGSVDYYIPPEYCDSGYDLFVFMSTMLEKGRQKAKNDLEKTIAGLYPKEEQLTGYGKAIYDGTKKFT
jgi:hypothetical protein